MRERVECLHTTQLASSNAIVNIHIPYLTEDKRSRRTRAIQKAAEDLLKSRGKNNQGRMCNEYARKN